jgi:hypothetical protein
MKVGHLSSLFLLGLRRMPYHFAVAAIYTHRLRRDARTNAGCGEAWSARRGDSAQTPPSRSPVRAHASRSGQRARELPAPVEGRRAARSTRTAGLPSGDSALLNLGWRRRGLDVCATRARRRSAYLPIRLLLQALALCLFLASPPPSMTGASTFCPPGERLAAALPGRRTDRESVSLRSSPSRSRGSPCLARAAPGL